jgi:hypothetical protein
MAIKRNSELTSYGSESTGTVAPVNSDYKSAKGRSSETSDIKKIQETYAEEAESTKVASHIVGRTYPDLLHDRFNDPRMVAVVLMLIPVIIFAFSGGISKFEELLIPFCIGVFLNFIWFGLGCIVSWRNNSKE